MSAGDDRGLFGLAEAVGDVAARILPGWEVIAFSPVNPEDRDNDE
jgi:hypothetical protein